MKFRVTLILAGLAAVALLLAACGPGPNGTNQATIPVPTTPPIPLTPAPDTRIVYTYTGGIAGFRKELSIRPQGSATLVDRGKQVGIMQIGQDRLADLVNRLEAAKFFELQDNYEKDDTVVSDDIYVAIMYTQQGRTKTVSAALAGGEGITPQAYLDVVKELNAIMAEIERQPTQSP
jgi:hypothetical protein